MRISSFSRSYLELVQSSVKPRLWLAEKPYGELSQARFDGGRMGHILKLGLVFALVFFASPSLSWAASVHGVFRVVKGKVQVKSARNGKVARAKVGQKVYPQDTVITGPDSRAKIVMIDNNEINVSPDSEVTFEKYEYKPGENKKDVLLNVIYGKVRSKVEQKYDGKTSKFQIKTPSAVAGVRGTDFLTSFDSGTKATNVVTFEGQVEFGTPGVNGEIQNPVTVSVGQMASAVNGQPPAPPAPVPAGQLTAMDQETDAEKAPEGGEPRTPAGDGKEQKKEEPKKEGEKTGEAKKEPAPGEKKQEGKQEPKQEPKQEAKQQPKQEPKQEAKQPGPKQEGRQEAKSGSAGGPPKPGGSTPGKSGESRQPSSLPPKGEAGAKEAQNSPPPRPTLPPPPPPGPNERPPEIPGMPMGPNMAELPLVPEIPDCGDFCREAIENSNTQVIIKISN